ncbi:MAG: hypothetical protein ABJA64_00755 [Candidatus Saccharibacteria bacterium]
MLARFIVFISALAAIVLLFFLVSMTPVSAGPLGILVVFICLYILVLGALTFLLWGIHRIIAKLAKPFTVRRPIHPISLLHAYYFSSVIALVPVMLVGMQSVGTVSAADVALVLLFAVIGCVYIAKRTAS